jgi:hypothetical protein
MFSKSIFFNQKLVRFLNFSKIGQIDAVAKISGGVTELSQGVFGADRAYSLNFIVDGHLGAGQLASFIV